MTPPLTTSIVIDIVFIPIYAVLAGITIYNFIRLRSVKFSFGTLLGFTLVRLVGNICSVAAWADSYQNQDLFKWGSILSIIGYSFLLSSVLSLHDSAKASHQHPLLDRLGKIVHLVNTLATVLLIIGITHTDGLFTLPPNPDTKLNGLADVGTVLYIVITAVLAGLVLLSKLAHSSSAEADGGAAGKPWAPLLLSASLLALPLLLVRLGYTCYTMFGSHLLDANVWARLVCSGIVEIALVVIFNVAGFRLGKFFPAMRASSSSSNNNKESEYHVAGSGGMVEQQSQYYGTGGYVQTRQAPSPDVLESQSARTAWSDKHHGNARY
ncbi:hypothetical protein OC834_001121 [Tilletia horrida]|nr:hypothetical protein OC834_001121 [Tilletia horrida]